MSYSALVQRFERITTLQSIEAILDWDTAVVMPPASAAARAEQLSALRVMTHELLTDPEVGAQLDACDPKALDPWDAANLREMRRLYRRAAGVPADLIAATSEATSRTERAWRHAKRFTDVAEPFAELVTVVREVAAARGEALGCSPYDAMLDEHEPGMTSAQIDPLFAVLERELPTLVERVLEGQSAGREALPLAGPFDVARQRALGERLMREVGFDFERGRLDVSAHPFCGGTPDDLRITTRYDEVDFTSSLMGVLHETGHALYERGLPERWRKQPVGQARSMAIHESQSLLVEMQACRSPAFIGYLAPIVRETFGGDGPEWSAENLRRLYRRVSPSFIRVDADEVTYPAHILFRYRLERDLIDGRLAPHDLPEAWEAASAAILGLRPNDDRLGCMQDIHWFDGAFGYFPSYTLGAIFAAQLFARAEQEGVTDAIASGDLQPLVAWLRPRVHEQGSRWSTPELVERAVGAPLDVETYLSHLRRRYLDDDTA